MSYPIKVIWTGDFFVPQDRFLSSCRAWWGAGQILTIDPQEERDMASHRHYMASIAEAWDSLPEELVKEYPSAEHLRKKTLIKTGWADEKTSVYSSHEDALIAEAFAKTIDDTSIYTVSGNIVICHSAKSQSLAAMGKKDFQKSKWDVLDAISALIGVTRRNLEDNAGKSA